MYIHETIGQKIRLHMSRIVDFVDRCKKRSSCQEKKKGLKMDIKVAHSQMSPRLLHGALEWEIRMEAAGLHFAYTCVARKYIEQVALYSMGRYPTTIVNEKRTAAGLFLISAKENVKVTWTKKSKHIVFCKGDIVPAGYMFREKSDAFDFVILDGCGKMNWDLKVNANKNQIADYQEAGVLANQVGLRSGITFGDSVHIEVV